MSYNVIMSSSIGISPYSAYVAQINSGYSTAQISSENVNRDDNKAREEKPYVVEEINDEAIISSEAMALLKSQESNPM